MKGLFLALEGIDGAGKSSQISMLTEYFQKAGRQVRALHFPRTGEKPYGPMIASFLRGDYGKDVHPQLAALLYALDRQLAAPGLKELLNQGNVIIADRYVHSNICYQCAKIDDPAERQKITNWIEELEYIQNGVPRPDLALFLDAPLDFALNNLTKQRGGQDRDYLNGKADIHEANTDLQKRVRQEFITYAEKNFSEMAVVDCAEMNGAMADPRTIHSRVLDRLRYYAIIK